MSDVLLFHLFGLSLPVFVFIVVRYAQAPGIKDPSGVQGFAMALGRMRILIIKKKQKKTSSINGLHLPCYQLCKNLANDFVENMNSISVAPVEVLSQHLTSEPNY